MVLTAESGLCRRFSQSVCTTEPLAAFVARDGVVPTGWPYGAASLHVRSSSPGTGWTRHVELVGETCLFNER